MTGTLNQSWPGDTWKTGGGSAWLGGTYDPELNLLYIGTSNPGPWNSWVRPGDNKWTSSTLAIDPDSGEIKWAFQTTPHDGWDFDGTNEFIPFELTKDGQTVKAGAKADRNGFFYVLNRETGKFISASPFVSKITWATGIDENGRPQYDDNDRPKDPDAVKASGKDKDPVFAAPSFLGGKNWMPMAYSQKTGLFYVPSNEWGMDIWNEPINYKKGAAFLGAGFSIKPIYDDHIGVSAGDRPGDGQDQVRGQQPRPALGRRAGHGRRARLLRHARGLPPGGRRQDRRGGLEVQHRLRRRRLADHLGAGRRAVRRGQLRLGRGGPALGRCGGRHREELQPGRHALGVQARQGVAPLDLTGRG